MRSGVYVVGRAVGDFTYKAITTAKNKPLAFISGKILAGQEFVTVTESVEPGSQVYLPADGDELIVPVVPNWKANGVIVLDVKLPKTRPVVAEVQKK